MEEICLALWMPVLDFDFGKLKKYVFLDIADVFLATKQVQMFYLNGQKTQISQMKNRPEILLVVDWLPCTQQFTNSKQHFPVHSSDTRKSRWIDGVHHLYNPFG